MKSIRIHSYGSSSELKLEDVPTPSIRASEVLVRVRAIGVNPFDWKFREGYFKDVFPATLPVTLGAEYAGDVVESGKEVGEFKAGDKVFGFGSGTYSEFVAVPEKDLIRIPRSIDYETAAS